MSHLLATVVPMETIVGLLFWGGLLVLASRGVIRSYRGSSSRVSVTPTRPVVPPTGPSAAPTVEESAREGGALVEGLIIGHHLTRTHYEDRLAEQADAMQSLRDDVADHSYPGGDELDELDELDDVDDMGVYRADDVADGSGPFGADGSGSDGSDEFGVGDDPWDDVFGHDEDDDY